MTRAEVADEVDITVKLAAFHLEKLVAEGFLEATYERDEGSAVVGHPAKRYRPSGLELEMSIPPRRYDLAAEYGRRDANGLTPLDHCRSGRVNAPDPRGHDEVERLLSPGSG